MVGSEEGATLGTRVCSVEGEWCDFRSRDGQELECVGLCDRTGNLVVYNGHWEAFAETVVVQDLFAFLNCHLNFHGCH